MPLNHYISVPPWARFLSLDDLHAFLITLAADLLPRSPLFTEHCGVLQILLHDGRVVRCGLSEIALRCAAVGRAAYARVIAEHLDRVLGAAPPPPSTPPPMASWPESFDAARPRLRMRLYDEETIRHLPVRVIGRPVAPGIHAAAVCMLGDALAAIAPEHAAGWGVTEDQILNVALDRLHHEPTERAPLPLPCGAEAFSLLADSFLAPSQILALERHLGSAPPPLGALVAVPNRFTLLCCVLTAATVVDAVVQMTWLADAMYHDTPDGHAMSPLSPSLYWWRRGEVIHLPTAVFPEESTGYAIAPPKEFLDGVLAPAIAARRSQRTLEVSRIRGFVF